MAYNKIVRERVRKNLSSHLKVEEKNDGGLTFMVNSKMCLGILGDDLKARIDPEFYEVALKQEGCRKMDFTGRSMKGFVFIDNEGTKNKKELNYWIKLAINFNHKAKSYENKRKN